MWSMPVVLTETKNENDSQNQNDVAMSHGDSCCTLYKSFNFLCLKTIFDIDLTNENTEHNKILKSIMEK